MCICLVAFAPDSCLFQHVSVFSCDKKLTSDHIGPFVPAWQGSDILVVVVEFALAR